MQVRHILQGKGRDVIAVAGHATISDVAKVLTERRIGAVIVKDGEGRVAGIISERDLVHAIAAHGAAALAEKVEAHMTSEPETCIETDSVELVM